MLQIIAIKIIILLLSIGIFAQGEKYGVFVGVGKYTPKTEELLSSANDATKMQKAFLSSGGTNSILLTDEKAKRSEIIKSINHYQKIAKEHDLFIFYYSGHGTLFPDRYSEFSDEDFTKVQIGKKIVSSKLDAALVPIDSTADSAGKPWKNLILDDELYQLFAGFTQKKARVVFISDSCYSGGQAKTLFSEVEDNKENPILGKQKFIDWKAAIGIKNESEIKTGQITQIPFKPDPSLENRYIMIASSQNDESSYSKNPQTGYDSSLFTFYFLETFEDFRKTNRNFTFQTILDVILPKVKKIALQNNGKQTPRIDNEFFKSDLKISVFQ